MGVPAFFRWLSRKYPSVVVNCIETLPKDVNGKQEPVDSTAPNPNGIEFDNLYLDMNGIIHPCTHPEDKPAPKNEDEMMIAIFEAIDRLLNVVRPRKLLYMAVDGVAPRAKMNQQRSRRFRASKESTEKVIEIAKIRSKLESEGAILPPPKDAGAHFDSNCITPGTPFMDRLSRCLHYYAHNKLNKDPAWKNLKIILSDANVPGEGEHKIMDFIRKQRAQPNHNPNTTHCLCGADADLIMLGLATHEPHFYIIREEFKTNMNKPCDLCGVSGHELRDCQGLEKNEEIVQLFTSEVRFIFVRLCVLREYLRRELDMPGLPFTYDFERAIDDWVFMCFFVGNDFLPHLPSLEIREGAIDRLVGLYKKAVYKTGGFVTENGYVSLNRVQLILSELGYAEDEIFKKRQKTEEMFRARDKERKKRTKIMNSRNNRPIHILSGQYTPTAIGGNISAINNPRQEIYQQRVQSMHTTSNTSGAIIEPQSKRGQKRTIDEVDSEEEDDPAVSDEVRLWESGFKDRYYESKFDVSSSNISFRHQVALEYTKGLAWVLHYYYQGCPSWNWYFPYHYAPFASDFIDISSFPINFDKGEPFKPLEQLMSVFPAASKQHVPVPWSKLMNDPDSPIIDFYPEDFKIDLNGKKFAWQGVALLPFVDENRLHKALAPLYCKLTEEERRRNIRGDDRLYVSDYCDSFSFLNELYLNKDNYDTECSILIDATLGRVLLSIDRVNYGGSLPSPVCGLEIIKDNKVVCMRYRDPSYSVDHIFSTKRLPGAIDPPMILKPQNLPDDLCRNWKPQVGMVPATQIASLGISGHRMLGHYTNANRVNPQVAGTYCAVPPPHMLVSSHYNNRPKYNPQSSIRTMEKSRGMNYCSTSFAQRRRDTSSSYSDNSKFQYSHKPGDYNTSRGFAVSYNVQADRSYNRQSSTVSNRPPYTTYHSNNSRHQSGRSRLSYYGSDNQRNTSNRRQM